MTAARGTMESKDFFINILDEHTDGTVLKSAVYLLGEKLRLPEVAERIFLLLDHQYDDVKEAALEACVAIGGPAVRERFVAMAESEEPIHRLMSTYALGKLGASDNMDILTRALDDEVPDIRKVAIEALASACDVNDDWRPLVLSKLNDESKDVRLTVIEIMGQCYADDFVPYLIEALNDEDDWVKIRAVDALGEHRTAKAIPRLVELLEDSNRFLVMKCIEALGNIGGTSAFRALLEITNSDEYEMVSAAEEAITKIQQSQE